MRAAISRSGVPAFSGLEAKAQDRVVQPVGEPLADVRPNQPAQHAEDCAHGPHPLSLLPLHARPLCGLRWVEPAFLP